MGACENGRIDAVDRLLAAGANVNLIDMDGNNALSYACEYGNLAIVDRLLVYGVDINVYEGKHPIIEARDNIEIIERLIHMGADIEIKDENGYTCLWWAIDRARVKVIQLLINNNAKTKYARSFAENSSLELIHGLLTIYNNTDFKQIDDIMNKLRFLGVNINYQDIVFPNPTLIL